MRGFGLWVLILSIFFAFACAGDAESADAKYGVVNVQRVLQASKAGRDARASLDREKKRLGDTLKKGREDLANSANKVRDLQLEIDRKNGVWRQEERERKTFELRSQKRLFARKQDNLKRLLRESERDLQDRQKAALARIFKEVRGIVHEIGKKEGFDVVVDSASGGVLFANPKVDLTDRVIKRYDQKKK